MASNARRAAIRRRRHENQVSPPEPSNPAQTVAWREIQLLLDEEIQRLPGVFREAFVLCIMEHKSCAEVADQLGINPATVRTRLNRARQLLQRRLSLRGVSLASLLAATALAEKPTLAAVPPALAESTSKAALAWTTGKAMKGIVTTNVATLVEGAVKFSILAKISLFLVAVLLVSSAATGTAIFINQDAKSPIQDNTLPPQNTDAKQIESKENLKALLDPGLIDGNRDQAPKNATSDRVQQDSLDELLRVYKELGVAAPSKDAPASGTPLQVHGGGAVNGAVQPVVYRLVFQLRPATKTRPPLLLEGMTESDRFWLDDKSEVDPTTPMPKNVDLRIGGLVLAIQCHSMGWDRLANRVRGEYQAGDPQPPRQQLVQIATGYLVGRFLRGGGDEAKLSRQMEHLSALKRPFAWDPDNGKEELVLTHMSGVVRDDDGQAIAGATIAQNGTYGFAETRANSPGAGRSLSDALGRYRLSFYTRPVGAVQLLGLSAQARGFVSTDIQFRAAVPVLRPGATTEMDIVLSKGEVMAGRIQVPSRLLDSLSVDAGMPRNYMFRVRSSSFVQEYRTEPGGAFEIWVPKGSYDLELIISADKPPVLLEKNVASGARDLKLSKVDPAVAPELLSQAFDVLKADMARN